MGKPGVVGVYTNQRFNLSKLWEGSRRTCQGLKPDPGNLAVRHFRGASRTVRHGETVNPPAIERAGSETPHLQQGALDLYPNRRHHSKPGPRLDPTRPIHVAPDPCAGVREDVGEASVGEALERSKWERAVREIRTLRATWRGLETWHGRKACRRASPRLYRRARCRNGVMVEPLRHRQTKGAGTDMSDLQPPRHISTPPQAHVAAPRVVGSPFSEHTVASSITHRPSFL